MSDMCCPYSLRFVPTPDPASSNEEVYDDGASTPLYMREGREGQRKGREEAGEVTISPKLISKGTISEARRTILLFEEGGMRFNNNEKMEITMKIACMELGNGSASYSLRPRWKKQKGGGACGDRIRGDTHQR
ncbi:hypothetical protein PIB30_092333, partial [Stylosanthes scabra]|nr:hypothetical protein [Stylosanthes scabra]